MNQFIALVANEEGGRKSTILFNTSRISSIGVNPYGSVFQYNTGAMSKRWLTETPAKKLQNVLDSKDEHSEVELNVILQAGFDVGRKETFKTKDIIYGLAIDGSTSMLVFEMGLSVVNFVVAYSLSDLLTLLTPNLTDLAEEVLQLQKASPVNAVAAVGTITVSGTPVADETLTIGGTTWLFKATRALAGEITLNANNATQVTNIVTAVNLDSTEVICTDGAGDTVVVTAAVKGIAGNDIDFAEAATGIAVNGSGKLGTTTAGLDGTPGSVGQIVVDASYIYVCTATNTISDANWKKVAIS